VPRTHRLFPPGHGAAHCSSWVALLPRHHHNVVPARLQSTGPTATTARTTMPHDPLSPAPLWFQAASEARQCHVAYNRNLGSHRPALAYRPRANPYLAATTEGAPSNQGNSRRLRRLAELAIDLPLHHTIEGLREPGYGQWKMVDHRPRDKALCRRHSPSFPRR
jgi:hypothetical protein